MRNLELAAIDLEHGPFFSQSRVMIGSFLCLSLLYCEHLQSRTYGERNQGRSYRASGSGHTLGGGKKKGVNIRGLDRLGDANCSVGGG